MVFRDKFSGIFKVEDPPNRIAISFAVGVFMGMSPLLGVHTVSAFFLAWLFGLNRFIAVAGVYITNPWTIVPIYSFSLWFGAKLIGLKEVMPHVEWNKLTFIYLINKLTPLVLPFVVGTVVLGVVSGIISYFIIYYLVIRYRKLKDAA